MTFCFNGKTTRLPSGTCWLMRKLQDPCGTFLIGQTLQLAAFYTLTGFWLLTGNWWIYGLMSLSMWNVTKLMKRRVLHCQDLFIFVKSFKMGSVLRQRKSFYIFKLCTRVHDIKRSVLKSRLDGQVKELHWTMEKPSNIKETPKIHRNNMVFSSSCDLERDPPTSLSHFVRNLEWVCNVLFALYGYVNLLADSSVINVLRACFCCVGESFQV